MGWVEATDLNPREECWENGCLLVGHNTPSPSFTLSHSKHPLECKIHGEQDWGVFVQ